MVALNKNDRVDLWKIPINSDNKQALLLTIFFKACKP